ncbi:hypothetical protein A3Q56_06000 [Intoshia linei]|uniref:Uncharacterized protein n=1 Tax=Intoshia linei TaxID=1819745 RepID=A0A177AY12_9BILA|nr:hypothetical protein A3Q56_06000 [Intoshia linei]
MYFENLKNELINIDLNLKKHQQLSKNKPCIELSLEDKEELNEIIEKYCNILDTSIIKINSMNTTFKENLQRVTKQTKLLEKLEQSYLQIDSTYSIYDETLKDVSIIPNNDDNDKNLIITPKINMSLFEKDSPNYAHPASPEKKMNWPKELNFNNSSIPSPTLDSSVLELLENNKHYNNCDSFEMQLNSPLESNIQKLNIRKTTVIKSGSSVSMYSKLDIRPILQEEYDDLSLIINTVLISQELCNVLIGELNKRVRVVGDVDYLKQISKSKYLYLFKYWNADDLFPVIKTVVPDQFDCYHFIQILVQVKRVGVEKGESLYDDYKKLTLRDTIIFADLSWNKVTQSTILNCFKHLPSNENGHVNYEKISYYKCYIKSLNIHDPITEEFINIEYTEKDEIMSECSTLNIESGLDEQFENDKIIIDTSVIKTTPYEFIHSLQTVEKFLYEKEE